MKRPGLASIRKSRRALVLVGLLVLIAGTSDAIGRIPAESAIERLEAAVMTHPEDPDLNFALTRKLALAGRASDAIRHTRKFLARWPERRPDARVEIAGTLIGGGHSAEALILLDEELRRNPRSATARFYRGIALRSEGSIGEANREFALAAELAPTLLSESLLAQALGLFDLGKDERAVDLLRKILEIDPTSESAIRARLMLRRREALELKRWWQLDAHAGFEWDDNVLLESAANESVETGEKDVRGVWGLGATARAFTTEKGSLVLGYRFDQTMHQDLDRFDLLTNSGFASGSLQLSERIVLRLDVLGWNTRQGGDNELTAGLTRPNLIVVLGPRLGALRGFAQYQVFEYDDDPVISAFERDGFSFGGGLEHFVRLPFEDSFLSTSVSYQRNMTNAGTGGGSNGFDGDNDYHSTKLRIRARLKLPLEIRAEIEGGYSNDRYVNVNFLYALRTLRVRKREDDIVFARISLRREIINHTELDIYWRGTWRDSNLSFFDYNQNVVGVLFRVTTN